MPAIAAAAAAVAAAFVLLLLVVVPIGAGSGAGFGAVAGAGAGVAGLLALAEQRHAADVAWATLCDGGQAVEHVALPPRPNNVAPREVVAAGSP